MHSQLYLTGRLADAPETGTTKKGKLWIKLLVETELVRADGRGGFQSETVILPVSCFSRDAQVVKNLHKGDPLTIGAHLYGSEFTAADGAVRRGVQLVCDQVFLTKEAATPLATQ